MSNNEEIIKSLAKLERSSKIAFPLGLLAFVAITSMLYVSAQELKNKRLQIAQADKELDNKRAAVKGLEETLKGLKKGCLQGLSDTQARLLELDKKVEEVSATKTPSEQTERLLNVREEIAVADAALMRAKEEVNKHQKASTGYAIMNIDIFYCEKKQATSQPLAQAILAKKNTNDVGRWRVRFLPESVNQRPGYQISGSEIRFTPPDETTAAKALLNQLSAIGVRASLRETSYPTPGYISAFICQ